MRYEWHAAKAEANLAKHGVGFEAVHDFDWNHALVTRDRRRAYDQPRFIALGPIGDRIHVLVFAWRSGAIRVISLRKANVRERNFHETET